MSCVTFSLKSIFVDFPELLLEEQDRISQKLYNIKKKKSL